MDSATQEPISDVKVSIKGTSIGAFSGLDGKTNVQNIPNGNQTVVVFILGHVTKELELNFPLTQLPPISVLLVSETEEFEEVIIESTRANRSVANLPTRTEVLTDEIDEAASMEPSKISHLITHSTGIQVQTTSASSNGAVVRIQGLNGRYTQMLKDGFPLYGGFSGSLDVMQIPPLDLRQVEYIKGSASTIYGGNAIAGIINLITKKPIVDETLLHVNVSHIGAKDFNSFVSRRFGKFGFTNLASMHLHTAYDPDNNGYSDLPEVSKFNFNPKLFYYPTSKTEVYLGATISLENRIGGSMRLIEEMAPDSVNFYYDKQKSNRYTSQFSFSQAFSKSSKLAVKNSISLFDRFIKIRTNSLGTTTQFGGGQLNTFSEINYNLIKTKHILNIGLNGYSDRFREQSFDTVQLRNQDYLTLGLYANHLWDISKKIAVESGFRLDYAKANSLKGESEGELFPLPRISALFKVTPKFGIRAGGGMGYRMPTIFSEDAEPYGYHNVQAIDFSLLKAERSIGVNVDFKYQSDFGSKNILLSLNQMFFYNQISNPILLFSDTLGRLNYSASTDLLISRGFETQLKLTFWNFTWFVGYTFTDAHLNAGETQQPLTLTPKHSIKGDLLFVVENKWRIGWDYEYKSEQLLSNGTNSRMLITTGIIAERTIKNFVIFLNAENFTDVRQSRYESTLSGANNTPQFTDIWAPLDGFFFNAGLKIKL
jgi:outer membrane receptor for ferrienterochelin and colicins